MRSKNGLRENKSPAGREPSGTSFLVKARKLGATELSVADDMEGHRHWNNSADVVSPGHIRRQLKKTKRIIKGETWLNQILPLRPVLARSKNYTTSSKAGSRAV